MCSVKYMYMHMYMCTVYGCTDYSVQTGLRMTGHEATGNRGYCEICAYCACSCTSVYSEYIAAHAIYVPLTYCTVDIRIQLLERTPK